MRSTARSRTCIAGKKPKPRVTAPATTTPTMTAAAPRIAVMRAAVSLTGRLLGDGSARWPVGHWTPSGNIPSALLLDERYLRKCPPTWMERLGRRRYCRPKPMLLRHTDPSRVYLQQTRIVPHSVVQSDMAPAWRLKRPTLMVGAGIAGRRRWLWRPDRTCRRTGVLAPDIALNVKHGHREPSRSSSPVAPAFPAGSPAPRAAVQQER